MREAIMVAEGSMWEELPWSIEFDHQCSSFGGQPCRHCHSKRELTKPRADGGTYTEGVWICPRVVVAKNEAGCASTGVCLDCILEAAAKL